MGKAGGAIIGTVAGIFLSVMIPPLGWSVLSGAIYGASIGYSIGSYGSQSPTYSFGEMENTRASSLPIPIVYGRHKVAGNVIYERVAEDGGELYICIGLAEGEIEGVEDVRVNDIPFEEIEGATYTLYKGTSTQQADSRVDTGEAFKHTAYLAFTFTANEQISSFPTITCVVKGKKVQVYSEGQWVEAWSNNPVWCILDLLTNKRYGLGKSLEKIDLDSFVNEALLYCDELVGSPPEKRFELDLVIDFEQKSLDILQLILNTCRGSLIHSEGKIKIWLEKSSSVVQAFDSRTIIMGSFTASKMDWKDIPNRVTGEFFDKETWEPQLIIYDNDAVQEDQGLNEAPISLYGITRSSQAGRACQYYHDLMRYCPTMCDFRAGISSIFCEPGDVIAITHPVPGWQEKKFIIVEMEEDENEEVALRCREYSPSIYQDRGAVYQPPKGGDTPKPRVIPMNVHGLSAFQGVKKFLNDAWVVDVTVSWTNPSDPIFKSTHIWLKEGSSSSWIMVGNTTGEEMLLHLEAPKTYHIRAVSEGIYGKFSAAESSPTITINVQEPITTLLPPTGLIAMPVYKGFYVKWEKGFAPRIDGYTLSFSTSEDGESWGDWEQILLPAIQLYSHGNLNADLHYRYRISLFFGLQQSPFSEIFEAGKPLKISVSEEIIDEFDWENWLEYSQPFTTLVADVDQNISAIHQRADEISSTVADLEEGTSTTFQQHANMIAQRVMAVDSNGKAIVAAQIQVGQVDGNGYILLDAQDVLVPGSMVFTDHNPGSAGGGQVTINSTKGIEIVNGKLKVVNPQGTTIIDGTSNMFKIRNSGYLWADEDSISSVVFNIPSSEVYIPAFHIIYEGFRIWGTGYGDFEGDAMWPFIIDGTVGVTRNIIGALVAITRTSASQVKLDLKCGRDTGGIYIRYYIFKEAAF